MDALEDSLGAKFYVKYFKKTVAETFKKVLRLNMTSTILLDFSLTVKAATLIFTSDCGSAISSAKEGKSGFIYNLVKSK